MKYYRRRLVRPAVWLAALLSVGIFAGCEDARQVIVTRMTSGTAKRNAKVEQRLHTALTTSTNADVLAWHEFLNKWPLARQRRSFAWYEALNEFQGDVSAATLIEDRYVFEAILNFEIDPDFQEVRFPKLRFHFSEVKRVIVPQDGTARGGETVSFQPDQKLFGLKEWKQLVESGWNFPAIGISVVSNAPIQDIQRVL